MLHILLYFSFIPQMLVGSLQVDLNLDVLACGSKFTNNTNQTLVLEFSDLFSRDAGWKDGA